MAGERLTHPAFGTGVVTGTPGPERSRSPSPRGFACWRAPRRCRHWSGRRRSPTRPSPIGPRSRIRRDHRPRAPAAAAMKKRPGLPQVALRKNLARAIRQGQPWIFRDALRAPPGLPDGAVVTVTAADGQPLARGFWDARSSIAVRVLAVGAPRAATPAPPASRDPPAAPPAPQDLTEIVAGRVQAALDRRLAFLDRRDTDAFRFLHGEADALPGVHADLYRRRDRGSLRRRRRARLLPDAPPSPAAAPDRGGAAPLDRRDVGHRAQARRGRDRARAGGRAAGPGDRGARERLCSSASTWRAARRAGCSWISATTAPTSAGWRRGGAC